MSFLPQATFRHAHAIDIARWGLTIGLIAFGITPMGAATAMQSASTTGLSVAFATYVGGSLREQIRDVAFDSSGNIYVAGGGDSTNWPVTYSFKNSGSPESASIQLYDVFVAKYASTGQLLWWTRIGGPNYDRAYALELGPDGSIYVAGRAGSGFPVTANAFQPQFRGGQEAAFYGNQDGFILRLSPNGSTLMWASYFGSLDPEIIRDVAVDAGGDAYITSGATDTTYPAGVTQRFLNSKSGSRDTVLARVASSGQLAWARYVGGSNDEGGVGSVRVDAAGFPVIIAETRSTDMPTSATAFDKMLGGALDDYVAKFTPQGQLVFLTYLGGSQGEWSETHGLAIDAQGNVVAAVTTMSPDFPTTPNAFDRSFNGVGLAGSGAGTNYAGDVGVAVIAPDGSVLRYATFIGGATGEGIEGTGIRTDGSVVISGTTYSTNFPTTADAFRRTSAGMADCFVAVVSADLSQLLYGTVIGGSNIDTCRSSAAGPPGRVALVGETMSTDFPTISAHRTTYLGGGSDAVAVMFTTTAPLPDADGDGVADTVDSCPGTPPNSQVNASGCLQVPVQNGNFSSGTTGWLQFATPASNYIVSRVTGGVLEFYRVPPPTGTNNQAVVFQQTGAAIGAGTRLEATVELSNSSSVRKRISVLMHDSDFSDLSFCTFWLAPFAPMRTYRMEAQTTEAWTNATVSFYAAVAGNDGGYYRVDNVQLQQIANDTPGRTDCLDPTAPAAVTGAPGPTLLANGDFASGALAPWVMFGDIVGQVVAGTFDFYRPSTIPGGVVLQASGQPLTANQILTANLRLGNTGSVRKRVTVVLHDRDFSDLLACTFWLPPAQPLASYTVRGFTTRNWVDATLSVYPATPGAGEWLLLDDVTYQLTPASPTVGTDCVEPAGQPAQNNVLTTGADTSPRKRSAFGLATETVPSPGEKNRSGSTDRSASDLSGEAGGDTSARVEYEAVLDLRHATSARLQFQSRLSGTGGWGVVRVFHEGLVQTVTAIEPSGDWESVQLDLDAFVGGFLEIQFVFVPDEPFAEDARWSIGDPLLTRTSR